MVFQMTFPNYPSWNVDLHARRSKHVRRTKVTWLKLSKLRQVSQAAPVKKKVKSSKSCQGSQHARTSHGRSRHVDMLGAATCWNAFTFRVRLPSDGLFWSARTRSTCWLRPGSGIGGARCFWWVASLILHLDLSSCSKLERAWLWMMEMLCAGEDVLRLSAGRFHISLIAESWYGCCAVCFFSVWWLLCWFGVVAGWCLLCLFFVLLFLSFHGFQ